MKRHMHTVIGGLLAAVFCSVNSVWAQGRALDLLNLPMGPRAVGMGGAHSGVGGDLETILYNPAGVGTLTEKTILAAHEQDPNFSQNFFSIGLPVGVGSAAFSLKIFSFDEQCVTDPNSPECIGSFTPRAVELRGTFARSVLTPKFLVGGSVSFVNVDLAPGSIFAGVPGAEGFQGGGTTVGFDLGTMFKPFHRVPLRFGAALLQAGRGIAFGEGGEKTPLPTSLRYGFSLEVFGLLSEKLAEEVTWLIAFDSEQLVADKFDVFRAEDNIQHLGTEVGFKQLLFLRSGVTRDPLAPGAAQINLGFAVRLQSFRLDFARTVSGNFLTNDQTHLSLALQF